MTTYYHYDPNGALVASNLHSTASDFAPDPVDADIYEQQGDVVGAYLARREMAYPAHSVSESQQFYCPAYYPPVQPFNDGVDGQSADQGYRSSDGDEQYGYTCSSQPDISSTLSWAGWASYSSMERPYPNPEDIRHLHTLQSLLPYLQPERRLNALGGPLLDIVEQDTGVAFAYRVPKKMLVLFLGRRVVNKFIRTTHREDDENWKGAPVCQELNLPRGVASKAAIKALIAWMLRACQYQTMSSMKQIRVPKNTFVACSLARTMELFELHKDALRVDQYIAENHFVRSIFAVELETLWNCLGKESRYVYAAIKAVGQRLHAFEADNEGREILGIDEAMFSMLKQYPELEARVRDPELNEENRPVFSTQWIKRLTDKTNQSQERAFDESRQEPNTASSNHSRDYQPASEPMVESQQSEAPDNMTRKFAVLRIVPGNTERTTSDAQSSSEPEEGDGGPQW